MDPLLFSGKGEVGFWVKGNAVEMLSFIDADLFPGGEAIWKVPAGDSEANTAQDGYMEIFWTPESGGKRVWGTKWRGRRSHSGLEKSRFCDEGQEEGSYRSNESTGEKA